MRATAKTQHGPKIIIKLNFKKECQGAGAFCVTTVLREVCWRREPRRRGSQPCACRGRDFWLEENKGAKTGLYLLATP